MCASVLHFWGFILELSEDDMVVGWSAHSYYCEIQKRD